MSNKTKTERRKVRLKVSKRWDVCYIDTDTAKAFADAEMSEEIMTQSPIELEVSIPISIKHLELRKALFPPIIQLAMNRQIWPKDKAVSLKLFLDNREIEMTEKGEFREKKYQDLCKAVYYKRWALLMYTYKDGSTEAILWWKKWD